jgi:O-methyltransferase
MPLVEKYLKFKLQETFFNLYTKTGIQCYQGTYNHFYKILNFLNINFVKGDYLEFGVFEGWSFLRAYHISLKMANLQNMNFIAFDSFAGLPKPESNDFGHIFEKGNYCCDKDRFMNNLKRNRVDLSRVKIVTGFYEESLENVILPNKASFIWIDCDLYNSTKMVLDFILPYLQDGTVISFDDWYCYRGNPNFGEQKAWYEWLNKTELSVTPFLDFRTFIINKGDELK